MLHTGKFVIMSTANNNVGSLTMLTSIFLIFTGAALFATLALFTRQSMLIAYIALGVLVGPFGLKWVDEPELIKQTSDIGILFLLFLLGLHLQPQRLLESLRKTTFVALISSVAFALIGFAVALLFKFSLIESSIIGAAMMFSSTLIGLKLLPTTVLHHQHTGEMMISILLLQDLIAILLLVFLEGMESGNGIGWLEIGRIIIGLPCLVALSFVFERFVLIKLLSKFDKIREYIFLLAIGWCLGMAQLTHHLGLSMECGAFIAGVVLAEGPIALYIAESLKPLRDFFLIMFFFSIGASFNLYDLPEIIKPALILAGLLLWLKPWIYAALLRWTKESRSVSMEVGVRLGQASEFSLLVAYLTASKGAALIGETASSLIQATTILTFIVSSYWVVWRYPTPIALSEHLRRD